MKEFVLFLVYEVGSDVQGAEFLRHTYLVFDANNSRLAMAKAAPDPGTGPITTTRKSKRDSKSGNPTREIKRRDSGILAIPSGTGTIPGAVFVQPLPVPPSPGISNVAVSSASSAVSRVVSNFGSSSSGSGGSGSLEPNTDYSTEYATEYSRHDSSFSSPTASGSMRPSHAPSSLIRATANPYPRPGSAPVSSGSFSSHVPIPILPSSPSQGEINVNIDFNQTIYIDSPGYGAEGFGWWQCSESDTPAQMPRPSAGTCVVNVAVMEYVHIIGEIKSTETVYLTTYSLHL